MKHTPVPYHYRKRGSCIYVSSDTYTICEMPIFPHRQYYRIGEVEANARFIVQACNQHEDLVRKIKKLDKTIAQLAG